MIPTSSESFRDSLGIVNPDGKRKWIFPKQPSGFYYRLRTLLGTLLLIVLFATPLLTVHGHPFMLFNVIERRFILFGAAFGPHDFYLFGLAMISLIVFVILFTAFLGRLFCGWVCPQTVLMETVFRRIDYWIEGDHRAQRRLRQGPWNAEKLWKKGTKYVLSFLVSFAIGNALLAWIIGIDELSAIITDPPAAHLAGLTAMLLFSGLLYWIFVSFREQACILVCPYGRLQGVLLDRNSIVIAYDHVRGEPRGKLRRDEERREGDCIDCRLCVDVCPTGIDIRNGTQLECVNCTACVDACNGVMTKIDRPRGLIRYDSAEGIARKTGFRWTGRARAYAALLLILLGVLTALLLNRREIDITILRTPGMFYQEQPDGRISNVYDVKVLNKSFASASLTFRLDEVPGEITVIGDYLVAGAQGVAERKLLVTLERSALRGLSTPLRIEVLQGGTPLETVHTTFLGPGGLR